MFTKNYDNYKLLMFFGGDSPGGSPKVLTFTAVDGYTWGDSYYAYASNSYNGLGYYLPKATCAAMETGTRSTVGGGVYFGSGSAPATKEDHCLQSPITSGLSIINPPKCSFTEDGNGQKVFSANYVLTNTSDAEINIYEIGLFMTISQSSSAYYRRVLAERTVLTEPITIPVGESKLVTYKITVNETLNVE